MRNIFVSHAEEDSIVALQLALDLERIGYTTWCYQCDSVPGLPYLQQVAEAIQRSNCVLVIISHDGCASNQVDHEVILAFESAKPFIPVLRGVSHADWQRLRPGWRVALGAAVSIALTDSSEAARRIQEGLTRLGIHPEPQGSAERLKALADKLLEIQRHQGADSSPRRKGPESADQKQPGKLGRDVRRSPWIRHAIAAVVAAAIVIGAAITARQFWLSRDGPISPPPVSPRGIVVGVMKFKAQQLGPGDQWIQLNTRDRLNAILSKVSPRDSNADADENEIPDDTSRVLRVCAGEKIDFVAEKRGLAEIEAAEFLKIDKMISGTLSTTDSDVLLEMRIVDIQSSDLQDTFSLARPKNELIELQNEAAAELIAALHIELTPEKREALFASRTDVVDHYKRLNGTFFGGGQGAKPVSRRPASPQRRISWAWGSAIAYAQDPLPAEGEIEKLLRQYATALEDKNYEQIADLQLSGLNDEQKESLVSYFSYVKDLRVVISDFDVVVEGDEALATFTRTDAFTEVPTGRPVRLEVRVSGLLEKQGGRWKIRSFGKAS